MVAGRRQAIDSVAVKANASMSKLAEKEVLDDSDNYADELNNSEEDEPKQNNTVSSAMKKKKLTCIIAGRRKHIKICPKAVRNSRWLPGL